MNGGRQMRWTWSGLVLMYRERWRKSAESWLTDQSSRVTSHSGWHLGHALVRGCGGVSRVAGTVENWWDTCPGHGGCAHCAILTAVWWLSIKNTMRCGWRILLSLGLKTRWRRFWREPVEVRGITVKGVSRRSNFVWSVWPSDRKPRSWSLLPLAEWMDSLQIGVV
jgi:hypothetical protein